MQNKGTLKCHKKQPWPQTGPSVVKLWSPEQQLKEDDDDDDDDKTSMCIITGTLFIGIKFEKKKLPIPDL